MTMMTTKFSSAQDATITALLAEAANPACDEADHRIANSLQLLSAMVALEARGIQDPAALAALDMTIRRIAAIASVHRQLYRAGEGTVDLGAYLGELGRALEEGAGRRVLVDAASIQVEPEEASAIGIIVSELVTNACKYAYDPGAPGNVQVTLRPMPAGGYVLAVVDRGRGLAGDKPSGTGFGARLVEMMVARLGGHGRYRDARPGTRFALRIGGE